MWMEYKKVKLDFDSNIDYMKVLEDDDDVMIVSLDLLHLNTNRNQTNISKDCVNKSLPSFYNKPIIYRLNNVVNPANSTDVVEHARTEDQEKHIYIGGTIPESSPVQFVDRNNLTYLRMTGVVYKLYQQTLCNIIKNRGGNLKVSIEILPLDAEYNKAEDVLYIKEFKFLSVCLLGEGIEEGILGSQLNVTKYSLDDYNKKYLEFTHHVLIPTEVKDIASQGLKYKKENDNSNIDTDISIANFLASNSYLTVDQFDNLKQYFSKFSNETEKSKFDYLGWLLHGGIASYLWTKGDDCRLTENKEIFVSKDELGSKDALTIDKKKESMSEGSWSDEGIRKECLMAKNWKEVCRAVFLKLEDGWEDGKEGSLGYPVMEKTGDKVVYNHKGLASARAYAVKNNETGVLTSLRAIYKHLGLEWDDSDKNDNSDKKVTNEMEDNDKKSEKVENAVDKVEDTKKAEKTDKPEDEKSEKVENAIDDKSADNCDYKAEYTALKEKFDAMEQNMKKYQRKDEEEKMSAYLNKFAHCYSADELKNAQTSIEKASYEDFAKSVDDKVKEFVINLKNAKEEKPEDKIDAEDKKEEDKTEKDKDVKKNSLDFAVSPFMPNATYDFSNKENGNDLNTIIKNSNVKLKN